MNLGLFNAIFIPLCIGHVLPPCIASGVHIFSTTAHYYIGRVFNIGQAVLQGIGDGGGCPFCQVAGSKLQLVVDIGALVLDAIKICIAVAFFYSDIVGAIRAFTIRTAGRIRGRFNKPHAVIGGTVK